MRCPGLRPAPAKAVCCHLPVALACALAWSSAFADVTISNFDPSVGSTTVSGPITATYSTPYLFTGFNFPTNISVAPSATANLATGIFFDGMSYSGTVSAAEGQGDSNLFLPTLVMADSFTLTGSPGQVIPWSMTLVATPQFGPSSSNVYDNEIVEDFRTGSSNGGAGVFTGGGDLQQCFSTVTAGCGGTLVADLDNNVPYTMTFSGTIGSGGNLSFNSNTSGTSAFTNLATDVSSMLALDPIIRLIVPAGVSVQSSSGVFPVTTVSTVPEPGTGALVLAGLAGLAFLSRRPSRAGSAPAVGGF